MLGDPHEAYRVYEELLALSRRIGNRQSEGKALINMGIAQSGIGNKAQAIGLVKQAVRIFEETNAPILADAREILTKLEGSQ